MQYVRLLEGWVSGKGRAACKILTVAFAKGFHSGIPVEDLA